MTKSEFLDSMISGESSSITDMLRYVKFHDEVQHDPSINDLRSKLVEDSVQLHIPGYNFTGPGTHVFENIREGIKPINELDQIAKDHDLDYVIANGDRQSVSNADFKMIRDLDLKTGTFAEIMSKMLIKAKILANPYTLNDAMPMTGASRDIINAIRKADVADINDYVKIHDQEYTEMKRIEKLVDPDSGKFW